MDCGGDLKEKRRGIAVVLNGKVLASLALPAAGLMSQLSVDSLAPQVEQVEKQCMTFARERARCLRCPPLPWLPCREPL